MLATAEAQPNIALIKYWGKSNLDKNLPAVGSLSITLKSLVTRMSVDFDMALQTDELVLNGVPAPRMLPRVTQCLDHLVGTSRAPALITSECNFPVAAGLASSAASFAALVVAASYAAGLELDTLSLARAAGQASGSAARSLYGGFVELRTDPDEIFVEPILDAASWPLAVIVAVTATGEKPVSSGQAMNLSAASSPFYAKWVEHQNHDLDVARAAVAERDFGALAAISEHSCLKMHSVMWASRPPIVYWNKATLACMETVRKLQKKGLAVFFTIDAGPQVKAVCLSDDAERVRQAMQETDGVITTMRSELGSGARVLSGQ